MHLFAANETSTQSNDANWLRFWRTRFGMTQSNLVTILEISTGENVNPGRIAEIETGQRCIPSHWREKLERLFDLLQEGGDWRELITRSISR